MALVAAFFCTQTACRVLVAFVVDTSVSSSVAFPFIMAAAVSGEDQEWRKRLIFKVVKLVAEDDQVRIVRMRKVSCRQLSTCGVGQILAVRVDGAGTVVGDRYWKPLLHRRKFRLENGQGMGVDDQPDKVDLHLQEADSWQQSLHTIFVHSSSSSSFHKSRFSFFRSGGGCGLPPIGACDCLRTSLGPCQDSMVASPGATACS